MESVVSWFEGNASSMSMSMSRAFGWSFVACDFGLGVCCLREGEGVYECGATLKTRKFQ